MKQYQRKVCYTSNHSNAISMQKCRAMNSIITVSKHNLVQSWLKEEGKISLVYQEDRVCEKVLD